MIDVYWWSKVKESKDSKENFGDFLVPYILKKTTTQEFRWVMPNKNSFLFLFKRRHYIIIGSIIRRATTHSIVWGAGIMYRNVKVEKAKFLVVRGPLTRQRLVELGYEVPKLYGDPALLIRLFNQPKEKKVYKLGLIPHFLDFDEVADLYSSSNDVLVINLLTNNVQEVIDQINNCEKTISSSLHGLIISHTLNIPSLWSKVSDKLVGDDVKFYDYYLSVGIDYNLQIPFRLYDLPEIDIMFSQNSEYALPKKIDLDNRILDLINSFPFRKSKLFKSSIEYFNKKIKIKDD